MAPHVSSRVVLAVAWLGLTACDLAHLDQKRFCASASSDPALCASRPDWCIATGGAACVEAVEGASCFECAPSRLVEKAPCVPKPTLARDCPGKARRLVDGAFVLTGAWDWKTLDKGTLEPFVGKRLTAETVAALNEHDRHMLCGPGAGGDWTGKLPCVVAWNADAGRAQCVVDEGFCASACRAHLEPFRCIPKNLCSGVICP